MSENSNRDAAEPAHEENERPAGKAVTWTEAIVPIAGIAFSIYYLSTIWGMPYEARMSGMLVSIAIFILTALLIARWCRDAAKHGIESGVWTLLGETNAAIAKRLSVLALTIAYVMLLPRLGFFVATFSFLLASMAILGVRKPLRLVLVPLIATSIAHLLFIVVLGISLPIGVVGELLDPIRQAVGL